MFFRILSKIFLIQDRSLTVTINKMYAYLRLNKASRQVLYVHDVFVYFFVCDEMLPIRCGLSSFGVTLVNKDINNCMQFGFQYRSKFIC